MGTGVYTSFGHVVLLLILPVLIMWAIILRTLAAYREHRIAWHDLTAEAHALRTAYDKKKAERARVHEDLWV